MNKTLADCVGSRVLVHRKLSRYSTECFTMELKVMELSPSGQFVKVKQPGDEYEPHWADIDDYKLVEVLK